MVLGLLTHARHAAGTAGAPAEGCEEPCWSDAGRVSVVPEIYVLPGPSSPSVLDITDRGAVGDVCVPYKSMAEGPAIYKSSLVRSLSLFLSGSNSSTLLS